MGFSAFAYLNGSNFSHSNEVSITGGAGQGSTNITVSTSSGVSVGKYLEVDELNTGNVTMDGSEGPCNWCDGRPDNGARSRGQMVEVESVNGNSIGISPALFTNYNAPLSGWNPSTQYGLNTFINPSTQPTHYYEQIFNNSSTCLLYTSRCV